MNYEPTNPTKFDRRLASVKDVQKLTGYQWATERYLRHLIFNAEDRYGSRGTIVPGNGLAPAIIRIGRKVLIDLDAFDAWIDGQRSEGV
ncbi:MAG: hypothetical protein AAF713_21200 [Pseudomonadota bacterium]